MKRDTHHASIFKEFYFHGLGSINSTMELPAAEELSYSDEEVREVCEEFQDMETRDWTS